jgi:hypothetical protein
MAIAPSRHCERSEAIQSVLAVVMDCVAALAMTMLGRCEVITT